MKWIPLNMIILSLVAFVSCTNNNQPKEDDNKDTLRSTGDTTLKLPEPTQSSTKFSKVIGWPEGKTPKAPEGFEVTKFASGLNNPRWIYVAPNGDILIAEANTELSARKKAAAKATGKDKSQNLGTSSNRITLFRDKNKDGKPEVQEVFLSGLNQPFGMLVLKDYFYVANTDGLYRYPYKEGATKITAKGERILTLPAGGYNNHWTRNLLASKDGSKIYISVGSGSNNGEHGMQHEVRRANILEINPDGSGEKIYAAGLRNPVGMDWNPQTKELWTAVNERDRLGDELVPDYITSVKKDGFYGWPYSYFGQHEDPTFKGEKKPALVKKTIVPDVPLGSHTASLGFTFYDKNAFPSKYQNGAFIGQHGSWNSSKLVGYKVLFVPFKNGKPLNQHEDFLTGFIAKEEESEVYGRPVGVTVLPDGSLLVADDAANTIWRVSVKK